MFGVATLCFHLELVADLVLVLSLSLVDVVP
jgi:hypothetical protein